jgi:hypothetical protein
VLAVVGDGVGAVDAAVATGAVCVVTDVVDAGAVG